MTILQILKEKYPIGSTMTLWSVNPSLYESQVVFEKDETFDYQINLVVKDIVFSVPGTFWILFTNGQRMYLKEE